MIDSRYKAKHGKEVSPIVPTATEDTHAVNLGQVEEIAAIPNVEFVYLEPSNTSQQNADIINGAIQRAIPTYGEVIINETPSGVNYWYCRTINWDNRVNLKGSGAWNGTRLASTHAEPLIQATRMSVVGAWGNVSNIYLDGEDIGTIGIDAGPNAFFNYERVAIKNFTVYGMKTVSHILGSFTQLRIRNCPVGWYSRETTGIESGDLDVTPVTGGIAANALILRDCYFNDCTIYAIDKDKGSGLHLINPDFERCGTSGDVNTGIIKFTNISFNQMKSPGLTIVNAWMEHNHGTYFNLQSAEKVNVVIEKSLVGFAETGAKYFNAVGSQMTVKMTDCGTEPTFPAGTFDGCTLLTDNTELGTATLTNNAVYKKVVYQENGVPSSTPTEEQIIGTADENTSASGAVNLDLSSFTEKYLTLTGNVTTTLSNTPSEGKSFVRSLIVKSTAGETWNPPSGSIVIGGYVADGNENYIEMKFSNFPNIGLKTVVYINQA